MRSLVAAVEGCCVPFSGGTPVAWGKESVLWGDMGAGNVARVSPPGQTDSRPSPGHTPLLWLDTPDQQFGGHEEPNMTRVLEKQTPFTLGRFQTNPADGSSMLWHCP